MGWFQEQVKQRMESDEEAFFEAFEKMAEVVMGKSALAKQMNNQAKQSQSAIEEILQYYHKKPQELPASVTSMEEQLEYQLRPHGIMYRRVRLREKWYKDGVGILLGSTRSGDIIVLKPGSMGTYRYFDRRKGKYVRVTGKNEKEISREAICFYHPLPLKKLGIRELVRYLVEIPSRADILLILFITMAVTLLGLLVPKVNKLLFSHIAVSDNMRLLLASVALLAGVAISSTLTEVINQVFTERLQTKMNISVESAAMMRILSLPSAFFKKYGAGNIGNRMEAVGTLCGLISETLLSVGLTSLFSLLYIGQIFHYAPSLALPSMAIIFSTLLLSLFTAFVQMKNERKKRQLKAKEQGLVYAMITGVSKIKLAGAEKRFFARWAENYTKSAVLTYAPPAVIKYNAVLTMAVSLVGNVILYAAAVKGGVKTDDYMAFQAAYAMVTGAFGALSMIAVKAADVVPILEMTRPILESLPEIAGQKKHIERLSGGIELNHISFRYSETMPLVIDDLSLKIRPGQYVALVGGTGCGKSTLIRLMLGFETPDKGAVYYDGKDLDSLDLKSLRQNIGVVMQNGKLFQGDIYSNIVISAPQLTMEEAWEAAEMAGMAEDIRHMPMGMHTLISEGTGGISGGQRQRIMIARAIAPKPKILMFDEATSALDNITQKIVSESLEKLKCTRIVIAHRLSTIRQCDRIVVLDKGKIIEDGTYEELLKNKGFFAELVARQQ